MDQLFEIRGLAVVGPWVVAAIAAKAIGYACGLLASGGSIYLAVFPNSTDSVQRSTKFMVACAAVVGAIFLFVSLCVMAGQMAGAGLAGAVDPMMVSFAWESPMGTSTALRSIGFALTLAVFSSGSVARIVALVGASLIIGSYAFVGHSTGEPRWALAVLLVVHLFAAAFWVGALLPLWRVADEGPSGAATLHRFGKIAAWVVAVLVIVGTIYAWYLSGSPLALVGTAYGAVLVAKIGAVAVLLGLAALNKLRLVPALASGSLGASSALKRSIIFETVVVLGILLATATLTSITTPPVNM